MTCSIRVYLAFVMAFLCSACGSDDQYELIERSQQDVPNYQEAGSHTEVGYVLLHDGHRFHATCDMETTNKLDPSSNCALRILFKYECRLGNFATDKVMSDLVCKSQDGGGSALLPEHNVYLYVFKKE
jgi:hypothetical protein